MNENLDSRRCGRGVGIGCTADISVDRERSEGVAIGGVPCEGTPAHSLRSGLVCMLLVLGGWPRELGASGGAKRLGASVRLSDYVELEAPPDRAAELLARSELPATRIIPSYSYLESLLFFFAPTALGVFGTVVAGVVEALSAFFV